MANLPDIFCIHESDADLHLGHLQQISQKFIEQGRVGKFVPLSPEEAVTSLPHQIKAKDLIILLLTDQLTLRRVDIKDLLARLQSKYSNLIIAEVIIDHIQYDKDYISWPSDLTPIRSRDDMDSAWSAIESNLNEIIPQRRVIPWKKYVIAAAAVIIAAALLIWLVPGGGGKDSKPGFTVKIMDSNSGRIYTDTGACYLPCIAVLTSNSGQSDSLIWNISDTDTTILMEKEYSYLFAIPGEHTIKLTTQNGKKKKSTSRKLFVKAPLVADFDAENDGCQAPCHIRFVNKSGNGRFKWKFDGINDSSSEANPRKEYPTPGEYNVTLSVVNDDNLRSDTVKKVTIREDDSPFAEFTTKRRGHVGLMSRNVEFVNSSKNANEYIWNFGDGSAPVTDVSPTHTYNQNGTYKVELIAKRGAETNVKTKDISVGIYWHGVNLNVKEAIEENPRLKAQARKLHGTQVTP
jgi:PKD repeat protein